MPSRAKQVTLFSAKLLLSIGVLGYLNPATSLQTIVAVVFIVALFSASQDIVIDAYRIELLSPEEQGAGAAATQWGYRFGLLASGAGALYAVAFGGWASRARRPDRRTSRLVWLSLRARSDQS